YSLAPNSIVEKPASFPSKISILFSERPDPKVSYIHVTNPEGQRADNNDFKITGQNGREGTISLDKNLIKNGVYSVSWLTLSLDDGHVAKGAYVVGVGHLTGTEDVAKNARQQENLFSPILAIIKAPIIIGQVCILGFVISQMYLWNNFNRLGIRSTVDFQSRDRVRTPIIASSIVMAIMSTMLLLFQAAVISESESNYFVNLTLIFFETNNGLIWLIRITCCIAIMFASYCYYKVVSKDSKINGSKSLSRRTILLYVILFATGVFIASNSFVSHSSSVESWSHMGILTDFIHSVVVSIWIGGLMYISYVFFPNLANFTKVISEKFQMVTVQSKFTELVILARFSVLATVSIGIIGITGLSLAWLHINTTDELLLSDYGKTLIAKLCIALPAILMGGYHQLWINRMVNKQPFGQANETIPHEKEYLKVHSTLKLTIKIEVILMICILCAASLLTVTSPPSVQDHNIISNGTSKEHNTRGTQREFARTLEAQGVPISLVISPFFVGFNNFTINILGENQNIDQVSNVFIEFKKQDLSLGPIYAKLVKKNNTAYSIEGGYLSGPGAWDLKLTIQRSNLYDVNYRLGLVVNESAPGINGPHGVETVKFANTANKPVNYTLLVILLSLIIAALSTYFCIKSLKRLRIAQQYLEERN
ncbi:MAG TPA: CopD family protein, partial [Nitrososphaeraceae archaeon]